MNKLKLIWHLLFAENFTAIVKRKKGGTVLVINADKRNANAHLMLLIHALKEMGMLKDDTQAPEEDNDNQND